MAYLIFVVSYIVGFFCSFISLCFPKKNSLVPVEKGVQERGKEGQKEFFLKKTIMGRAVRAMNSRHNVTEHAVREASAGDCSQSKIYKGP